MTEPHEIYLDDPIQGKVILEFDTLESCLELSLWTALEARLILAGVDIQNVSEGGPYRFLPGALQHLWGPNSPVTDWSLIELRLREELEVYSRYVYGPPRKPLEWLKASLEVDCEPCWARLLAADGREEFLAAIRLVAEYPDTGTPQPIRREDLQPVTIDLTREGADIKFRRSRYGRAFYEIVKAWDHSRPENSLSFSLEMERLYDEPEGDNLNLAQKEKLADQSPMAKRKTIQGWIKTLARETRENPFLQAEKVRKRRYIP